QVRPRQRHAEAERRCHAHRVPHIEVLWAIERHQVERVIADTTYDRRLTRQLDDDARGLQSFHHFSGFQPVSCADSSSPNGSSAVKHVLSAPLTIVSRSASVRSVTWRIFSASRQPWTARPICSWAGLNSPSSPRKLTSIGNGMW